MQRTLRLATAGLLLAALSPTGLWADAKLDAEEGQALAAELRAVRPPESFTNTATLRITNPEGQVRRIPVTITTLVGDEFAWSVTYSALVGLETETLTVTRRPARPPAFELGRTGEPLGSSAKTLGDAESAVPFAGSDFWLRDLGLGFLHWPEQRLIRKDKPEMRKGRPCKILESADPGATGYSRVRSWIDAEHKGLILAEAYDSAGKLVKRFSIGSLKKVEGEWQLKDMEMIDEVRGGETRLEFDLKVK